MGGAIGFEFPPDQAGQWNGFNEPGIEHFSGSPFEHLGREVPQNTIDARAGQPARLRIALITVPTASVPGVKELKEAIARCSAGAPGESAKAATFFQNAHKLLEKDTVKVLQIADYNTTGVVGPCVNGRPFFAMMKATGQSKKAGTSTGSFGIGKFAPFTVSELRTVFVTTVWKDEAGAAHHYAQGKSILMSHMDGKKTRQGTGFWGVRAGCMPVEGLEKLPTWLQRTGAGDDFADQAGTTLSILGFAGRKNWERALAANIAENFFGAIQDGNLEVEIEGGLTINQATLPGIFDSAEVRSSIEDQRGEPDKFSSVKSYLRALSEDPEVKIEETQNLHLGKCQLRILVREGLPKRVAVLRNGMLITDELQNLKRFGSYKEFVAVLECRNEKGQALLREMEPPRHDDFEPERLPPDRQKAGRIALREITKWVRDMLDRHAKDVVTEVTTLDELADFFGDEEEEGQGKQKDENPGGAMIIRQRPVKAKARVASYSEASGASAPTEADEDGDEDKLSEKAKSQPSDNKGKPGPSPKPDEKPKDDKGGGDEGKNADQGSAPKRTTAAGIPLRDVRAVPLAPNIRRVAFTPSITGTINVELQDSGADANYMLDARQSSEGTIKGGRIEGLSVKEGNRVVLEVTLDHAFDGTLRVVANAV